MKVPTLAVGAAAGALMALALVPATVAALARLEAARSARAGVTEVALRPAIAALPPDRLIRAPSRSVAADALAAHVRRQATSGGVLVETATPVDGGPLARVALRLSGSEAAVLGLAVRIERSAPLARFTRWRIEGSGGSGGSVRLTGEVASPWG